MSQSHLSTPYSASHRTWPQWGLACALVGFPRGGFQVRTWFKSLFLGSGRELDMLDKEWEKPSKGADPTRPLWGMKGTSGFVKLQARKLGLMGFPGGGRPRLVPGRMSAYSTSGSLSKQAA